MAAQERTHGPSGDEGVADRQAENPRLRCGLVFPARRDHWRFGGVSDFGSLARRISGWTTNLLATALVLVGGLAIGWQVLAWWKEAGNEDSLALEREKLAELVPQAEGREFWTKRGPVKVERVRGSAAEATWAMRAFCKAAGERTADDAGPAGEAGPGEARFVKKLREQEPWEDSGRVSVYQPAGQTGMMVGVRRPDERIVAWSFVLPAEEGMWLVYHFRPVAGNSAESIVGKP